MSNNEGVIIFFWGGGGSKLERRIFPRFVPRSPGFDSRSRTSGCPSASKTRPKRSKTNQRAFLEYIDGYKIFIKCSISVATAGWWLFKTWTRYIYTIYAVAPVGVATTYSQRTFTSTPSCSSFNITFRICWLVESDGK